MISVIVPTRNEADWLPAALAAIARNDAPHEVIVADAQSTDATAELAAESGARVVTSTRKQRAWQMNLGARCARGGALLFLHADTILPPSALSKIETALTDESVAGGAFARRYESASLFLKATCALAELRTRAFGWFLGDQGIFARRRVFEKLGGFADLDLFEDLDFSRRMRRQGRVITLRPPVVSSARRFERRGPAVRTWLDFFLTLRYLRGEDPARLADDQSRDPQHDGGAAPALRVTSPRAISGSQHRARRILVRL
jgi:rSAM/selenodomain-associated transferase 2